MISLQRQVCGESLDWKQGSQVNQMGHDGGVVQVMRSGQVWDIIGK